MRRPLLLLQQMFADLVNSRQLAWRLFLRDLRAQYRQSLLGYVWLFLPPLLNAALPLFLNNEGLFEVGETPIPYPAYLIISTALWQNFVDAVLAPLKITMANRSMLTKINFPREALLLAGMCEVTFNFLLRLLLIIPVMIYCGVSMNGQTLLAVPGFMSLLLLGSLLGILLTPLGLLYGDIQRFLTLSLQFGMWLTPVVYPPSNEGIIGWLSQYNPVSPLLVNTRSWLLGLPADYLSGHLLVAGVCLVLMGGGWVLYRVSLPHLIARLGM